MAFTKTNWTELIPITADRLNNMELQLDEAKAYTNTSVSNHTAQGNPHSNHVIGNMRITVSATAPSNPTQNDIWIQI